MMNDGITLKHVLALKIVDRLVSGGRLGSVLDYTCKTNSEHAKLDKVTLTRNIASTTKRLADAGSNYRAAEVGCTPFLVNSV